MTDPTLESLREAREALDAVVQEIQQIPGFGTFLQPPTFTDVANAAQEHALVYLAAAGPGGVALVVRGDDVEEIDLPDLTHDALVEQVSDYLAAYTAFRTDPDSVGEWDRALDEVTGWLWTVVMGRVTHALVRNPHGDPPRPAAGTDVPQPVPIAALVTGGLLGLLPLHAAWQPDSSRSSGRVYALDLVQFSYAPNARALTAARQIARTVTGRRVHAVAAPNATRLRLSGAETKAAYHAFPGGTLGRRPTATNFLTALGSADVIHVACHGVADLDEPLQSRLELAPRQNVTLEMIMASQMQVRLAILSACETLLPGTELPDEVISLPTGLIQAGAAGVLASMWAVGDLASAILMIGFYERWRVSPDDPAAALRAAQLWLRDSSHRSLVDHFRALTSAGGWVPASAADEILSGLALVGGTAAADRLGGLADWAAFALVGA